MPDVPKSIYWDSCIFLHYIEGTSTRLPILDALLEDASAGRGIVIVTSTLSITEVAFAQAERGAKALAPEIESAIDALWNHRSAIRLVEFSEVIAREARTLLRRAVATGRHLKPPDAVHLATTRNPRVAEFQTTDDRPKTGWQDLGFPIRDPHPPSPTGDRK